VISIEEGQARLLTDFFSIAEATVE
jgi:hypothetical protein